MSYCPTELWENTQTHNDQTHTLHAQDNTNKALRKTAATPVSTGITEVLRQAIAIN